MTYKKDFLFLFFSPNKFVHKQIKVKVVAPWISSTNFYFFTDL